VTDVASGMDGNRPRLRRLLADPDVTAIVVEHRDRLTRFGFDLIASSLEAQGRRIVVLDDRELEDDLIRDMTEVLTSFCARLYGRRSAARRARDAVEAATDG
jgi:putative resolvase